MSEEKGCFTVLSLFKSVKTTVLCLFSLLIIITMAIFFLISMDYTEKTILENSTDYTSRLVRQLNRDIDSYIDYMENISSMVIQGGDVQKYLFAEMPEEDMEEAYGSVQYDCGNQAGYIQYCCGRSGRESHYQRRQGQAE